jgi:DNA polymerase-3 subunit epsilon
MRQLILDTETTGLDPAAGHRVIEIGCVELENRRFTGRNFHCYLNPGRDSDEAALEVHGLTTEFLSDKPGFEEVADEFVEYVRGAELIIHNAPFDVAFLDAELRRVGKPRLTALAGPITDSLVMAKERHPGKRNNLDALCERYGVSNAHRTLHGALLDGQLLAEVYLAMTRGQDALGMDIGADTTDDRVEDLDLGPLETFVVSASDDEEAAHAKLLEGLARDAKGPAIWQV